MKKTKFLRIAAVTLALIFVFATGAAAASAGTSESSGSVSDSTTSDIQEMLNTISYADYIENNPGAKDADKSVVLSALQNWVYADGKGTDKAEERTENGKTGLFIPSTGTVTWTWSKDDIFGAFPDTEEGKKAAEELRLNGRKYYIVIEYYPVQSKSTPIEKVLLINGEVPFAEARQIVIEKKWTVSEPFCDLPISDGKVNDKSVATLIKEAESVGLKAYETVETIGGKNGTKKNYLRYEMPTVWTQKAAEYVQNNGIRFFTIDIDKNEIRSGSVDSPDWFEYTFKDSNGFMETPFEVVLKPDANGNVSIALRSENEPIIISEIRLETPEERPTYKEYSAKYSDKKEGDGVIKLEAEFFGATSSQTVYPISDGTSAISSPAATDKTVLNTVGGNKWQSAGQWIEYSFKVTKSGKYQIVPRFKQNILDGMYVSRSLYIYSDDGAYDGIPFEEAGRIKFNYKNEWQVEPLGYGEGKKRTNFEFYFEEGVTYKIRFEVNLGEMGDIVRRVQASLNSINNDYLEIMKLTGSTPDQYRDYKFYQTIPDTMNDLYTQSQELYDIIEELETSAGEKSSNTATLEKVARLLEKMFFDEDEVAKNLEQLKTYIGTLGTWLSDAKTQPLLVDYINIQPKSAELPKANANIFQTLWFEIVGFVQSFLRHYDRMGAMTETTEEESVEVWLAYGRDQSQVIRGLINDDFTNQPYGVDGANIPVNLKLVSAGTLLPSILSQQGPDVYIGLAQVDVINYAIRGALISIDDLPEQYSSDKAFEKAFDQTKEDFYKEYEASIVDFNEAAMMVLEMYNSKGETHCYGLPETQNFNMMFVREDILAELDIDIPKTWDDVKAAIPELQANNMQIGMHQDVKIFLYQNGGELFADDGMRINLDSGVARESFTTMCEFFTMYSFPYKYDFANRFRTGEMPIGFATYTATYNQLKVFATEIEGLWGMYPMPGVMGADGKINNASVSTVTAIVMITGANSKHDSWEFMKWHVAADCQEKYSNEMVAILGPSAKHATANRTALKSMPWTVKELNELEFQFENLAAIPNYPGCYIVDRYLKFAFLDAYDDNIDPEKALVSYVSIINKEIERKRIEFDLEILDYEDVECSTLAEKRLRQAEADLKKFKESGDYNKDYEKVYNNIMELIEGYDTLDYASIYALREELIEIANENGDYAKLENKNKDKGLHVFTYLKDAADALKIYETYK